MPETETHRTPAELLAAVTALANSATPGPWYSVGHSVKGRNHHGLGAFSYEGAKRSVSGVIRRSRQYREISNASLAALAPTVPLFLAFSAHSAHCWDCNEHGCCGVGEQLRTTALSAVDAALGEPE